MKANNYIDICYNDSDKKLLENTLLSKEEKNEIEKLKMKFQNKAFYPIIEDLFKFHKNDYSTSELANIYVVSTRQIQRIFKELGINRARYEAQQIAVSKRLPDKFIKKYKNKIIENMSHTQDSDYMFDQYLRHKIDELLYSKLATCEIIVGIASSNTNLSESDIPIIIFDNNILYKYIISIFYSKEDNKREKIKSLNAFKNGYTIYKIEVKNKIQNSTEIKERYEKEIEDNLIEIINMITSEVSNKESSIMIEKERNT